MEKENKKNCSLETVINDANLDFKKEYSVLGKKEKSIIARKTNDDKKEYWRWSFDENGNMVDFSKGDQIGHNEFIQFLGDRIFLRETFYENKVGGTNRFEVYFTSPETVEIYQNGKRIEDKNIADEYKNKILDYKNVTRSINEIESLLKENGYKKNQKMNFSFSIDTKLLEMARRNKSYEGYVQEAFANGYFDMMEIGQNWEARNKNFSTERKRKLTFWF